MKKKLALVLSIALLSVAFLLVLNVGAAENDESSSVSSMDLTEATEQKLWTITMNAQVVANMGDRMAVYVKSPQNMAVEDGDTAQNLQVIPMGSGTTAKDSAGNAIAVNDVVPGQEVRITFQYYWQNSSPRTAVMRQLSAIELRGETLTAKTSASIDDYGENVLVGMLISKENGQMEIFVESGRVFSGNTEYIVQGRQRFAMAPNATILSEESKPITLNNVAPFRRVVITAGDAMWATSYPPQYVLSTVSKLQLLDDGKKVFSPEELQNSSKVTGTVLRVQQGANGQEQLVIQPEATSRQRKYAQEYVVDRAMGSVYGKDGSSVSFSAIRPDMVIEISYNGLDYVGGEGRIPWFNRIDIVE